MKIDYMELAYQEALKAYGADEIPVGAIIVKDGKVIATGYNLKEKNTCCIYHAEILAIIEASYKLNNWRLDGCDMYITLEPCPMCASAIKQSRIRNVYCGLSSSNSNNLNIIKKIFESDCTNPSVNFYNDQYVDKLRCLMQKFFVEKRKK